MTKSQILRRLFLAVLGHFIVFGLIAGFDMLIVQTPYPTALNFFGYFLHVCITTFVGIVSGFILCGICWIAFLPTRNQLRLRIIFALVMSINLFLGYLILTDHQFIEQHIILSCIAFISSQLVANYYLKLTSNFKIKRKTHNT